MRVVITEDESWLVVGSDDGKIRVFDASSLQVASQRQRHRRHCIAAVKSFNAASCLTVVEHSIRTHGRAARSGHFTGQGQDILWQHRPDCANLELRNWQGVRL